MIYPFIFWPTVCKAISLSSLLPGPFITKPFHPSKSNSKNDISLRFELHCSYDEQIGIHFHIFKIFLCLPFCELSVIILAWFSTVFKMYMLEAVNYCDTPCQFFQFMFLSILFLVLLIMVIFLRTFFVLRLLKDHIQLYEKIQRCSIYPLPSFPH